MLEELVCSSKDAEAELKSAVRIVEADENHRVLRRITSIHDVPIAANPIGQIRNGLLLDLEGTGLDTNADKVIELSMTPFQFDEQGQICSIGHSRTWREDPGVPLTPQITAITGLKDEDLVGQRIPDEEVAALVMESHIIIAHNVSYDGRMAESRFPSLKGKPWACTASDIDWRELGYDGRALSHLLLQIGYFYTGHRAEIDVAALAMLLAAETGGQTHLSLLIARARKANGKISAVGAPYDAKDSLKARGYAWDPDRKTWWKMKDGQDVESELAWLAEHVYHGRGNQAKVERIDWTRRHR